MRLCQKPVPHVTPHIQKHINFCVIRTVLVAKNAVVILCKLNIVCTSAYRQEKKAMAQPRKMADRPCMGLASDREIS